MTSGALYKTGPNRAYRQTTRSKMHAQRSLRPVSTTVDNEMMERIVSSENDTMGRNMLTKFMFDNRKFDDKQNWAERIIQERGDALMLEPLLQKSQNVHPTLFFQLIDFIDRTNEVAQNEAAIRSLKHFLHRQMDFTALYDHLGAQTTMLFYLVHRSMHNRNQWLIRNFKELSQLLIRAVINQQSHLKEEEATYIYLNSPFTSGDGNDTVLEYLCRIMMQECQLALSTDLKEHIIIITTHLVRFGANPFHTRPGTLPIPGTPAVRIFSPVSALTMLSGHDDDQIVPNMKTSWIAYICPDRGYLNLLMMTMIENYRDKYGLQSELRMPCVDSFLSHPDGEHVVVSHMELLVLCGKISLFEQIVRFCDMKLPRSLLNWAVFAYASFGLKGHVQLIHYLCARDMPLTKFPMELEMNGRKCKSRLKQSNKNRRSSRPIPAWADHTQIRNAGLLDVEVLMSILGKYYQQKEGYVHKVHFAGNGNILVTKVIPKD